MQKSLLALMLVAGCGGSQPAANRSAPSGAGPAGGGTLEGPIAAAGDSLAGLYEGGAPGRRNQLCLIEKGGKTQFGIVVWGSNLNSCSGAGEARRSGDSLSLRMGGDAACTIEARVEGGRIVLARAEGAACENYYCGKGARFDGAAFTRRGAGAAAAKKATDIAGDPLCG